MVPFAFFTVCADSSRWIVFQDLVQAGFIGMMHPRMVSDFEHNIQHRYYQPPDGDIQVFFEEIEAGIFPGPGTGGRG